MTATPQTVTPARDRSRRATDTVSRSTWYDPDASAWEPDPAEPAEALERPVDIVVGPRPTERAPRSERPRLA